MRRNVRRSATVAAAAAVLLAAPLSGVAHAADQASTTCVVTNSNHPPNFTALRFKCKGPWTPLRWRAGCGTFDIFNPPPFDTMNLQPDWIFEMTTFCPPVNGRTVPTWFRYVRCDGSEVTVWVTT